MKEILSDMSLPTLLQEIARPDFPSPACVSSSAIIAAVASSLIEMSCGCTLDEKTCSSVHPPVSEAQGRCQKIREQLLNLAQQDIEVFEEYLAVNRASQKSLKLPQAKSISSVKLKFTLIPLKIAINSCSLLEEITSLIPLTYEKVVCDLIIAKRLLTVNIGNMLLVIQENMQELADMEKKEIFLELEKVKKKRDQLSIAIEEAWDTRKNPLPIHN